MRDYSIDAIRRAFRVLSALGRADEPLSLTEISRKSELGKATTFRILATLAADNMVSQDAEGKKYRLGPALIAFGQSALDATDVREVSQAHMRALAERHRMIIYLNMPTPDGVLSVMREPKNAGSQFVRRGAMMPYHACASGLVFLAYNSDGLLDRVVEGGLPRLASGTICTEDELRSAMARIRADGFALDANSIDEGVVSVAAPVLDYHGEPIATLGASGPEGAMSADAWNELCGEIRDSANEISMGVGGLGGRTLR
jgi:DNA-binding IclR family transcriptional regulator